jgi:hypothetical protein
MLDGDGGFYESAFERLEDNEPSKKKEDVEVALLIKAQAKLYEEDLVTRKPNSRGTEIANRASQIAILKTIMETGDLGREKIPDCRKRLYKLATKAS